MDVKEVTRVMKYTENRYLCCSRNQQYYFLSLWYCASASFRPGQDFWGLEMSVMVNVLGHLRSRMSLDKRSSSQFVRVVNIELVAEETLVSPRPGWTKTNRCNTMFFHYSAAPLSPFYLSQLKGWGSREWYCKPEWDEDQILQYISILFIYDSTLQMDLPCGWSKDVTQSVSGWLKNRWRVFLLGRWVPGPKICVDDCITWSNQFLNQHLKQINAVNVLVTLTQCRCLEKAMLLPCQS